MTQSALRNLYGLDPETTIIPLVGRRFGPSLRPGGDLTKYRAAAIIKPGESLQEIIIARTYITIVRFMKARPKVIITDLKRW